MEIIFHKNEERKILKKHVLLILISLISIIVLIFITQTRTLLTLLLHSYMYVSTSTPGRPAVENQKIKCNEPMGYTPISNLHRNRRYFVIKLHTWFCLSYILKTNIKFYGIYQYFMSINSFFLSWTRIMSVLIGWPI
jgi:hypothetical protein